MSEKEIIEEIIEEIELYEEVRLSTNVITIEIARGDAFVGGTSEGYICDYLGSIQYRSAESVVIALLESLEESEIKELHIV